MLTVSVLTIFDHNLSSLRTLKPLFEPLLVRDMLFFGKNLILLQNDGIMWHFSVESETLR